MGIKTYPAKLFYCGDGNEIIIRSTRKIGLKRIVGPLYFKYIDRSMLDDIREYIKGKLKNNQRDKNDTISN
ncbi:hypothetical protein LCGC14_0680330 [marine sediment metagenome]|uniref:Uncharacterized protein n=1 Tax=marine sediment metagenome TaxID=412755 RepID=A0A0F9QNE8_9ZZZZ